MHALPQNGSSLQSLKTKTQVGLPAGGGSHGDRQRFLIIAVALLDPTSLRLANHRAVLWDAGQFFPRNPRQRLRGIRTWLTGH